MVGLGHRVHLCDDCVGPWLFFWCGGGPRPRARRFGSPYRSLRRSSRGLEIRSEISTSLAVSPDGRYLAWAVVSEGRSRLWLRSLDKAIFEALPGTEGAFSPFWSPDSRFIGFGAEGKLKKVEVSGGAPRIICDAAFEGVPTWNQFGTILFADLVSTRRGIMSVSADGGTPALVTTTEGTIGHNWPHFLPDGRHFLFSAMLARDVKLGTLKMTIFVGSLDGAEPKAVATAQSRVEYTAPGICSTSMTARFWRRDSISIASSCSVSRQPWPKAFDTSNRQARRGFLHRKLACWHLKRSPVTLLSSCGSIVAGKCSTR